MGFVAYARSIWSVLRDPANPTRNLLLTVKNSVGPLASGLAYSIEPHPDNSTASIVWHPDAVEAPAAFTLRTPKPAPRTTERRPTERDEARAFLRQSLADGPRPAKHLVEACQDRGFHIRTLQRAFYDLDGHNVKMAWKEGSWWSLGECPIDLNRPLATSQPDMFRAADYTQDVVFQLKIEEIDNREESTPQPSTTAASHEHAPAIVAFEVAVVFGERIAANHTISRPPVQRPSIAARACARHGEPA